MKKSLVKQFAVLAVMMQGIILWAPAMLSAQDSGNSYQIPEGVYIKLTKDFYEALQSAGSGSKVYTTDPSDDYLKQIAISTKFMVETNLEILKQQEKMNQLLLELSKEKRK